MIYNTVAGCSIRKVTTIMKYSFNVLLRFIYKYKRIFFLLLTLLFFSIYKLYVLDIVWDGVSIDEASAFKETILPKNAIQVIEAESQAELLMQSYFLIIPLIIGFVAFIVIGKKKEWFVPSKKGFILGAVFSFLLQGLHELLHGLAFPAGSTIHLGIIKANFSGYATSTAELNIFQCIFYYLLPAFVLGIIPLLFFITDKKQNSTFCWFCYGFAMIGLIQTAPDWFGLFPIIQQVPGDAIIQMSGWHTYWHP